MSNFTFAKNDSDTFDPYCTQYLIGRLLWSCFTAPSACLGLPASVWLLWVLARRHRSGLAIDVYTLNLTIMDLIFNIYIPLSIVNGHSWKHDFFLKAGPMIMALNTAGRPLFALCVCFDCYMAAIFPIRYLRMKHFRYRLVVCALVWGLTFPFGVVFALSMQLIYSPVVVAPLALALPLIVFFDVAVLHALRRPDPSGKKAVHPQKSQAQRTITFNLGVTVVAYLPPVVVFGCSSLIPPNNHDYFCSIALPVYILPSVFSGIMPLLYLKKLGILKDVMDKLSAGFTSYFVNFQAIFRSFSTDSN